VIGVAGVAVAEQLAVDPSPALPGVLQFLENQDGSAFPHHKPIPVTIKRATGALGFVIARAHGPHLGEAAHSEGNDGGFGTSGKHHGSVPALDGCPGFPDRMIARRARRTGGKVRAPELVVEREQSGSHVQDQHRDHER
jgi:hypothetical protein